MKTIFSSLAGLSLSVFVLCSVIISIFVLCVGTIFAENLALSPPILDQGSLNTFKLLGAHLGYKPLISNDSLPSVIIVTSEDDRQDKIERQVTFTVPAEINAKANEIFNKYRIPTYHIPDENVKDIIISPPTFIVRTIFDKDLDLRNNDFFTLTPILERIFPHMTILVNEFPAQKNAMVKVEHFKATFAKPGESVGFIFQTSREIPNVLEIPPTARFNTSLFLNIDYIGQESLELDDQSSRVLNFSDPQYFFSSPEVRLSVSKSLKAEKHEDGCPKMAAGLFDDDTRKWRSVNMSKIDAANSNNSCSYKLLTGHFSKFAVGGVVPPGQLVTP